MREAVHPEANIIFGVVVDDTLGDEIRVTVNRRLKQRGGDGALNSAQRTILAAA